MFMKYNELFRSDVQNGRPKLSWWCCFEAFARELVTLFCELVPRRVAVQQLISRSLVRHCLEEEDGWKASRSCACYLFQALISPAIIIFCLRSGAPLSRLPRKHAGRQTRGFLFSADAPSAALLFRLRKQEMTKDGGREGGADDNQLRGEKGGEVGKASGRERNGGRRRTTARAAIKVWLIASALDIEPSWEAGS